MALTKKERSYKAVFEVCRSSATDSAGFKNPDLDDRLFDPGWGMPLLFHDTFEHWFEYSDLFRTKQLSQAGECAALGVRQYFFENTSLVEDYAAYNQIRGVEWNSWTTILGQMSESKEEGSSALYPNDFKYVHHKDWEPENTFKNYADSYDKEGWYKNLGPRLKRAAETAFSYGYWLGEQMFGDSLMTIGAFCRNLKLFLDVTGISNYETFSEHLYGLGGRKMIIHVSPDYIKAEFLGVKITSNQSEDAVRRAVSRADIYEYY